MCAIVPLPIGAGLPSTMDEVLMLPYVKRVTLGPLTGGNNVKNIVHKDMIPNTMSRVPPSTSGAPTDVKLNTLTSVGSVPTNALYWRIVFSSADGTIVSGDVSMVIEVVYWADFCQPFSAYVS